MRRRRIALGAAALTGGIALAWLLASGPVLAVRSVDVRGEIPGDNAALEADIERAARHGTIVRPAVGEIRRAAAAHPWVESVSVTRDLPLGLAVRVAPTSPAAVATDGNAAALVAEDGRVLGPAPPRPGLPRLALKETPPEVGSSLPAAARAPLAFAAAAQPEVARRLRGLRVRDGRLVGRIAGGPELRLGVPDDVASKALALTALLSNLSPDDESAATYFDLSVPQRPVVAGLPSSEPVEDGLGADPDGLDP